MRLKYILTRSILVLLFYSFSSTILAQNILTVNGHAENGSSDYNTIKAAIDAASDGDIIRVYPGTYTETSITLDKPLLIQGTGFYVPHNYPENEWGSPHAYITNELKIIGGAETTIIEGLSIHTLVLDYVSDLVIRRCNVKRGTFTQSTNLLFDGCYMTGAFYETGKSQFILWEGVELKFRNCLFANIYSSAHNTRIFYLRQFPFGNISLDNCLIRNRFHYYDVLNGDKDLAIQFTNSIGLTIQGRITESAGPGSIVQHCLFEASSCSHASATQNIFNITPSEELVGYPTSVPSFDGQYQLNETSQAIGFATHGGDCGLFGGDSPYVLSGIPSIPFIYDFNADQHGSTGGGIDVNIKVKSQN